MREYEIIDFVCRNEFDYTCKELAEGRPWNEILGLSYRDADGELKRTEERPQIHDWDAMPSVLPAVREVSRRHEVLQRLPSAPVRLVVYRPRLHGKVHVLSVAANHRRPRLPSQEPRGSRPRPRRSQGDLRFDGARIHVRRRHADERKRLRNRAQQAHETLEPELGLQRPRARRLRYAQDPARQRLARTARRLRVRQPRDSLPDQKRV